MCVILTSVMILHDLVLVAKRKSLFDDKAVEIEELTYIIKQVSGIVYIKMWFCGRAMSYFV